MFKGVGRQLEFNKLLEITAYFSNCELSKREILSLKPAKDRAKVEKNLFLTLSLTNLLKESPPPVENFPDISPLLPKIGVEGTRLSPTELAQVLKIVSLSSTLRKFLQKLDERFSPLKTFLDRLNSFQELKVRLESSINEQGEVLDTASQTLKSIRQSILNLSATVRSRLENLTNRFPDICPDRIVTERDGRYVILAKPHFKTKFKGIVHDRSSSGQTLYVEPLSVFYDNNRLKELKLEEKREVERILSELSKLVHNHEREIKKSFKALVELDIKLSIANVSLKLKGVVPEFSNSFNLKSAKHPLLLLSGRETVPIDIEFDGGLVITGPNTGGKTVALKTAGLLSLMAQCGFLIPADEGSSLPFFTQWMADIGDEQSIEQSLSTFSAHISNIAKILHKADENSLVLLDELGAGTDPVEGSALAVGILKYLKEKKAKVIVTTHFTPVKLFAWKDSYFRIASVLFDENTLKPLYRLIYGVMGRSYAFVIAERFGIPKEVIENARSILTAEDRVAEEIVSALEKEYRELIAKKSEVESLKRQLEEKIKELEEKEKQLKEKGIEEIQEFIRELESRAEEVFRKAQKSSARKEFKQIVVTAKNRIEEFIPTKEKEVELGDTVVILKSGRKGKVVQIDKEKGTAKVLIGNLKVDVKLKDVEPVEEAKKQENLNISVTKPKRFFPELKLLGMRGEEAIRAVEQFLDDASLLGIERVKIVHGHGEGILKRLVRNYLRESPYVKSFRPGKIEEGGDGVTIVELK